MLKSIKSAIAAAAVVFALTPSASQALTIQDGLTPAGATTWNSLASASTDPVASLAYIAQLAPYLDQQAYLLPALFDGGPLGSSFDSLMMTEIAGNAADNVLDLCTVSPAACSQLFQGSDAPGDIAAINLASGLSHYFRITGPGGTFFSSAAMNADLSDHFLAFKVVNSGTVTITPTTLGGGSVTIDLLAGDLIIGIEDLPLFNAFACQFSESAECIGFSGGGDRDYNDMLFHARVTEVPEPATLSLLGLGALGLRPFMRRKRA